MKIIVTMFVVLGLGAALAGALAAVHGDWAAAGVCLVVLLVSAISAGVWETR